MSINKNVVLIVVAVAMTLGIWMMPETISAQSHQHRLLALTNYITNTNRMASVQKHCAGTTRADLINTEEKATALQYKKALASQLNIEGNSFINKAINGNIGNQITGNTSAFGIFIGFFVVGLAIMMIQWMCLCCCCCCPSCCPSKCCQKDENQQYSKCELYWPTIFLILLLLLIVIVSAIGLSKAKTFKDGISDMQCSVSMMLDDIVNGNVTLDGSYFIGVDPLIREIGYLSGNISTIQTQTNSLNSTLDGLISHFTTMRDDIQKVPKNLLAGGNAALVYNTRISDTFGSTTGTVESGFASILGSSNTSGIIGSFYTSFASTTSTLDSIRSGSASFSSGAGSFSSSVSGINTDLNKVKDQMNNLDNDLKSFLDLMETPKDMGTLIISLIYGIMLGLSILAMLGVVLMTFCDKYKCRYLMYFSCVILFFLGLLGFLLAIIFSILVPVMFLFCEWLDVTLTSTGFSTNTIKFISDTQVQNIITQCLPGGVGNIIGVVGGGSVNSTVNGLKSSMNQTSSFNTTAQLSSVNTALTNITTQINKYRNGEAMDVYDSDSIGALLTISKSQDLGTCAAYNTDSFVPSMVTISTSCSLSGTPSTVNPGSCTQANFESSASPCHGCMDSSLIFNAWYTSLATSQWKAKLDARYGAPCAGSTWTTYFGNVWDNYYRIKTSEMNNIYNRWLTVSDSTNPASDISQVTSDFATINSTMTNVLGNLTAAVDSIIDPNYGLIAGLNCKIIGEDLTLVVGSICVSNFNTLYITRLLMGIAAFGILFAMCCIVCSGVRHFKHSERKDKVSPNFMGDKNSFENTDAAFRP